MTKDELLLLQRKAIDIDPISPSGLAQAARIIAICLTEMCIQEFPPPTWPLTPASGD